MTKILPILIVVAIIFLGYLVSIKFIYKPIPPPEIPSPSPTGQQLKTFQSSELKFSIDLNENYQVTDKLGRVSIVTPNGNLYIERNSTNFNNLGDYLKDLDNRNKTIVVKEKTKLIFDNQAIDRLVKYRSGEMQKVTIIYANGWVYSIFSDTESLYDDLDQIAQSFRYKP